MFQKSFPDLVHYWNLPQFSFWSGLEVVMRCGSSTFFLPVYPYPPANPMASLQSSLVLGTSSFLKCFSPLMSTNTGLGWFSKLTLGPLHQLLFFCLPLSVGMPQDFTLVLFWVLYDLIHSNRLFYHIDIDS